MRQKLKITLIMVQLFLSLLLVGGLVHAVEATTIPLCNEFHQTCLGTLIRECWDNGYVTVRDCETGSCISSPIPHCEGNYCTSDNNCDLGFLCAKGKCVNAADTWQSYYYILLFIVIIETIVILIFILKFLSKKKRK